MKYISKEGLVNLKDYKYHGVDKSLLANYVMQPFWNRAVSLLPTTIAPNLVTLLGFFAIVFSYLLCAIYAPTIDTPAPAWVYLFAAVCLFWYQTMDALDGKQARRTGSSSPLGELFDHGCDAMTTTFMGLGLACAMMMGSGWLFYAVTLGSYVVFFMAQWEEYQTGTLELGYVNVTEIQFIIMSLYLTSYYFSPMLWVQEFEIFGFIARYNYVPCVIIFLGILITILGNIFAVLTNSKINRARAVTQLFPITFLVVGSFAWAYVSPSRVLLNHPHEFFITIGFIFAYITGRIVVDRVCKEPFGLFHPVQLGLVVAIVYGLVGGENYFPEWILIYGYMILSLVQYFHFAVNVISQMCDHLNIYCLKIPGPPPKKHQ